MYLTVTEGSAEAALKNCDAFWRKIRGNSSTRKPAFTIVGISGWLEFSGKTIEDQRMGSRLNTMIKRYLMYHRTSDIVLP